MIRVHNLQYRYDPKGDVVLNNINLEIQEGEYIGVIGPNGCGKTTLIRHFNALLSPWKGDVWVDDMNTKDPAALTNIRQRVGMVFQNPDNQIVGMIVEEDVSFGPGNLGLPSEEIRQRVEKSLSLVGMEKYAKRAPYTLSSGEKQLVCIAGLIAMDPACLVLDEPTAHLDPSGRKKVLQVLKKLHSRGITIVHVTHNMDEIVEADRIVVMNEGQIILSNKPAMVFMEIQLLRELGLDIPKVTELMWLLRQTGTEVRPDILTLNDACLELSPLIRSRT